LSAAGLWHPAGYGSALTCHPNPPNHTPLQLLLLLLLGHLRQAMPLLLLLLLHLLLWLC
jgi:hypothetical protein